MTDYQDALVLENLDLVNWVIRTRISIPNRPLLTYDDFYAIGCEAICRAALKYQPDISSLRRSSSATRATPIVKLLNYAESVAKRLKSALPGSAKYYLIIRRTEL